MARTLFIEIPSGEAIAAPALALAQNAGEELDAIDQHLDQDNEAHLNDQDLDHSGDAYGAHTDDGHHGDHEEVGAIPTVQQGVVTAVTAVLVFLLVMAVLGAKVWPTISKALDERERKIRDEIEAAEAARMQAKDALESYEKSLAEARAEAQQMLDNAKAEQQKLTAELKAKAEVDLAAMKEKAQREIESAKRAAVAEVYAEAASLATTVAGKILQREITSDDQQRLVNEAVAELSTSGAN